MNLVDFKGNEEDLPESLIEKINNINENDKYPNIKMKNSFILKKSHEYIQKNDLSKEGEFAYRSKLPTTRYNIPSELNSSDDKKYVLKCIFAFWSFEYEITKDRLVEGDRFSTDNMIKTVIGGGKLFDYIEDEFESKYDFLSFVFDLNYIDRAYYYDIDWNHAKTLLENGLTKTALANKIGLRTDIIDRIIDRHIGSYNEPKTVIQLSYDNFDILYTKEIQLINGDIELYEYFSTGTKDLGISESTLDSYLQRKKLKEKADINVYSNRKKIEKLEEVEEYTAKGNTYESEEKILRNIEFPIYWLNGFGADMIHKNRVVEIKRSLTSNSLYKAIVQTVYGYRKLSNRDNVEEKAVYVTRVVETEEHYWKKYAESFGVKLYVLNGNKMELYFDPEN